MSSNAATPDEPRKPQQRQPAPRRPSLDADAPVRYAVVGLGNIAQTAVLPAFAHAKQSKLAALVSDDPEKLRVLADKYDVSRTLAYDAYDELLASGDIDAVYIALPNAMHADFTIRALAAGVHVLIEKPMAPTEGECRAMIAAAEASGSLLMVAYRLHFERANLNALRDVQADKLGNLRIFSSTFTMQVAAHNIRNADTAEGGGPVHDLGIYCINAARGLFRAEPEEVVAVASSSDDARFARSPEMVSAILRFPGDRQAVFTCSFGAASTSAFDVIGERGHIRLDPAYEIREGLRERLTVHDKPKEHREWASDQFAAELTYFSDCVKTGREPEPSGAEGLADVRVIEAILAAVESGCPVTLPPFDLDLQRPQPDNAMYHWPAKKVEPVHAPAPHRED